MLLHMSNSRHCTSFVESNVDSIACLQTCCIVDDAAILCLDIGETTGENVVRVELAEAGGVTAEVLVVLL